MTKFLTTLLCAAAFLGVVSCNRTSEGKVMSYNIRLSSGTEQADSIYHWQHRKEASLNLMHEERPTVFGLQEACPDQMDYLVENLPEYGYIGVGRDDGKRKGEHMSIFYLKEQVELIDGGTFWLTDGDTTKPGKGWDARYNRICSWVRLKDKECKRVFWFFNLHMDHRGIVARRESSHLILKKIAEIANPKEPVILTGDFNVDQHNEIYSIIADSGVLVDSYAVAEKHYDIIGTFNGFKPQAWTDHRIDHIFISPSWKALSYDVPTDVYWSEVKNADVATGDFPKEQTMKLYQTRMPSDHFPVVVKLNYGSKSKKK